MNSTEIVFDKLNENIVQFMNPQKEADKDFSKDIICVTGNRVEERNPENLVAIKVRQKKPCFFI